LKYALPLLLLVAFAAAAATVADDLRHAQQLLWEKQYADAAAVYSNILRAHPNNIDALAGLATAEYWAGDFREARRDFARMLAKRPNDTDARKAVSDIDLASVPIVTSGIDGTTDDQPMRRSVAVAGYTAFSDPLTKWTATAGSYSLAARALGFGRATAPFAGVSGTMAFPWQHLSASASLRLFRFPDGHTQPLGSLALARTWGRATLTGSIARDELLYTATSLRSHPNATTSSLSWSRTTAAASSAAALRDIRYFDHNRGVAAEAYHLVRVAHGATSALNAGASFSYRDTNESRFANGIYDPYWTPKELREVRGILTAAFRVKAAAIHLHADAGVAHDADLARTFHPWRTAADADFPIRASWRATLAVERQSTVFYRANRVSIGITGRP
jgi:tetratricopeptide (TPR) repeat protein